MIDPELKTEFKAIHNEFKSVHSEFKAIRSEFTIELGAMRTEFRNEFGKIHQEFGRVHGRIDSLESALEDLARMTATGFIDLRNELMDKKADRTELLPLWHEIHILQSPA
jgi:uncharacterized coiled-coil DUF342 family protein